MYIVVEVIMIMAGIWRSKQPENVNFVKFKDFKVKILTETKSELCFIYIRKSGVKNGRKLVPLGFFDNFLFQV